jgi:hypothetical protein
MLLKYVNEKKQRRCQPLKKLDVHEKKSSISPLTVLQVLAYVLSIRVARGFVFNPKIPILLKFGGPRNRKCFFKLYYRSEYFMAIWYILQPLGVV